MTNFSKSIEAFSFGLQSYSDSYALQRQVHQEVAARKRGITLLFLEHHPVITAGKQAQKTDLLISEERLKKSNITYQQIERGGLLTAHLPGQLVVYPILPLDFLNIGVRRYVYLLEETVLRLLCDLGLTASRREAYPGIWLKQSKVCFIGIRVSQRTSMHGLALNVNCDLDIFDLIVPCGISSCEISCLSAYLKQHISMSSLIEKFLQLFCETFKFDSFILHKKNSLKI